MQVLKKVFGAKDEVRANNCPPCLPLFYHNISEEVKGKKKILAIMGIVQYALTWILLILNCLGVWFWFFGLLHIDNSKVPLTVASLILSAVWVCIIPPLAFLQSYMPTYHMARSKFFPRYIIFFVMYTLNIIFALVMCLGLPHTGGCGLLTGISSAVNGGNNGFLYFTMIWCFVMFGLWLAFAIYQFVMVVMAGYFFSFDSVGKKSLKGQIVGAAVKSSISNAI